MRPITNGNAEQFHEFNIVAGKVARRVNSHLEASGIIVGRWGVSVWALSFMGPVFGVVGIVAAWKWGLLTAGTLPYAILGLLVYIAMYLGACAVISAVIDHRINEKLRMIAAEEPHLIEDLRRLARKEYAQEKRSGFL